MATVRYDLSPLLWSPFWLYQQTRRLLRFPKDSSGETTSHRKARSSYEVEWHSENRISYSASQAHSPFPERPFRHRQDTRSMSESTSSRCIWDRCCLWLTTFSWRMKLVVNDLSQAPYLKRICWALGSPKEWPETKQNQKGSLLCTYYSTVSPVEQYSEC